MPKINLKAIREAGNTVEIDENEDFVYIYASGVGLDKIILDLRKVFAEHLNEEEMDIVVGSTVRSLNKVQILRAIS
jgi:hypothetical protein